MPPLFRLVSSEVYEKEAQNGGPPIPSDQELLDAYSRTVVQVAERAGLSTGDVIVGFDNQPVTGIDDLHRLLTEERVGRKVRLTIIRRSERMELTEIPQEHSA